MRGRVDMLDRAIGHQQSITMREVLALAGRAVDGPLHASAIVRMNALNDGGELDGRGPFESKYSERLFRPDDFAAGDAQAEAAGVAQSLGFRQIHFALPQR